MPSLRTLLIPPFLLFLSVPLAAFALFTSVIAFSILLVRVLLVYMELGAALLSNLFVVTTKSHSSVYGGKLAIIRQRSMNSLPTDLSLTSSSQAAAAAASKRRRSIHRTSISSSTSFDQNAYLSLSLSNLDSTFQDAAPLTASPDPLTTSTGTISTPLLRDYEGVGGWRYPSNSASTNNTTEEDDDALWVQMNSRLELPASGIERNRRPVSGSGGHSTEHAMGRQHRRSLTGGSLEIASASTAAAPRRGRRHTPPETIASGGGSSSSPTAAASSRTTPHMTPVTSVGGKPARAENHAHPRRAPPVPNLSTTDLALGQDVYMHHQKSSSSSTSTVSSSGGGVAGGKGQLQMKKHSPKD